VAEGTNVLVTEGFVITACFDVSVVTHIALAEKLAGIPLVDMSIWTSHRMTSVLISAANMVITFDAIGVIAK
jgi:hypothetical protein